MTPNEVEQQIRSCVKKIKQTKFTVDKKSIDSELAHRFCDILNEVDEFNFEPTSIGEPIGEIYHNYKLIGYIM